MSQNLRMPSMNKTTIIGRVTKDSEIRYTPSGAGVTNIFVAVNRSFRDKQTNNWRESTSFIPVVVWGRQAEIAKDRLKKGTAVCIEGRLQSRTWETKQGERRIIIEVIADRVQFLTKVESNDNNRNEDTALDLESNAEDLDEEIPF